MTTALLTHPDCVHHQMSGHPERPERQIRVMEQLRRSGIVQEMTQVEAREVSPSRLMAVHPQVYVEKIQEMEPEAGLARVDQDTYLSAGSLRAARLAAGSCVDGVELILAGKARRAFCAVRPPGHHAELTRAMGFCLFNNIAAAAEAALTHESVKRVAILDFDVHHCNGTVDIFKDRDEVLVCSSFQKDFYPHRYLDYSNYHVINSPLEAGAKGYTFKKLIEHDWLPALEAHRPDFILVSAGFDAHRDDPLGGLALLESDFRWVTRLITEAADHYADGRLLSTLEGGYDLEALASSVQVHVEELIEGS